MADVARRGIGVGERAQALHLGRDLRRRRTASRGFGGTQKFTRVTPAAAKRFMSSGSAGAPKIDTGKSSGFLPAARARSARSAMPANTGSGLSPIGIQPSQKSTTRWRAFGVSPPM